MKIQNPLLIKSAAFALSLWLRGWMCTVRVEENFIDPSINQYNKGTRQHLYLFWHETLFLPAYTYAKLRVPVLISSHRDGELVAQVLHYMGGRSIRGSSTRGGSRALREMLKEGEGSHLAITPDGPRGPRRVVQQGAVFLASHAQLDVVPVGICMHHAWRLKSWDRMAIPKPLSRATVVMGKPIQVPEGITREQMGEYLLLCQKGMDEAQALADAGGPEKAMAG